MQNAAIEIFYLFFQGILCFQAVVFLVVFIITRRKDVLFYCLFLLFAAAYFFLNAPYTFFGIPERDFWETRMYRMLNIPLIILENLFYLLFLRYFFIDITSDKTVEKVLKATLWLIPAMLAVFVLLKAAGWSTHSFFYIVKMISVLPAGMAIFILLKKKPPFAGLVANGLMCTLVGTILTVTMIALGNLGYEALFTVGYPLFFIRLGILGDMIFYLMAILRKWHFQEKQLVVEKLNAELSVERFRSRVSAELHDDLGSSLSGISLHSYLLRGALLSGRSGEALQSADYINTTSGQLVSQISEIIWAINPGNDEFDRIVLRMRNFAFEMLGARKIDYEFKVDDKVLCLKLPMETRKNLYLIFKEATNNLVKYSGAANASFSLGHEGGQLVLAIRDDGIGFDPGTAREGNGLRNMAGRAEEIGGMLTIHSEAGMGTLIRLTVPV